MAPLMRSRRLVCFYCGDKSSIQYDGSIRQWACGICLATNYLDENGDITDPPVAIVGKTVSTQYALPQGRELSTSSTADNALFCNDCIKNQHLVRSSLAQYVPEEKDTLTVDREYQKFRESLENRYPQICGDCVQGVANRLEKTSYTAKTDHLRRLLDRTREDGTAAKPGKTWLDIIQLLGHVLWSLGIYGQLAWNILGVYGYLVNRSRIFWNMESSMLYSPLSLDPESLDVDMPALVSWMGVFIGFLPTYEGLLLFMGGHGLHFDEIAKWSLILSLASLWWSPRFKEGSRGYHKHIKGFGDWYKHQGLLLVARILFWSIMRVDFFNDYQWSGTFAAHASMLGFTMIVTNSARKSIRVDFGPLFGPTPSDRLLQFVHHKDKSKYKESDMSQALSSIMDEVPRKGSYPGPKQVDSSHRQDLSLLPLEKSRYDSASSRNESQIRSTERSPSRDPRNLLGILRTVPSLIEMTPDESVHYFSTGEVPAHIEMDVVNAFDSDAMEWKPEGSEYRAFLPAQAPRQSQLFSQTPAGPNSSPFWYKGLPAAPVSLEHKIRNPPNKARLQAVSQEAKQIFFDRLTGRQVDSSSSHIRTRDDQGPSRRPIRHQVELAQQKLFFPADKDVATGLEDMFNQAFTLKPSGNETSEGDGGQDGVGSLSSTAWSGKGKHVLAALVLFLAWFGWHCSFTNRELQILRFPVLTLSCCMAVALHSLAECAMRSRSQAHRTTIYLMGAALATIQALASVYIIGKIGTGMLLDSTSRLQGGLLMGSMLLTEGYFVAFS